MCALPLSKVLPQRKTNSLDAERENFERSQSVSISKAINCQESPVKEKHVRSAIIGTFNEKGAGTFWNVVMKLPLQGNPIVCWKFCHVLHKVLREGHPHVILDSQKYKTSMKDLGKLWGLLKDGYGRLIQCYCNLLVAKLDFHRRNPRFPGNLTVTDEELDDIGERDVNVFFQLSCEFFDYMDEVLALQAAVFGSLDMSRSNSMTNCGQCRLAPLIPCIQDSSQLYDYTVKVLFKLHSSLPPDTLSGHRERFVKQFKSLQQFYISASNLQYFKHLIHVPLLPEKLPNFLIASDLSAHVSPVVILPPHTDTPENETIDMNLVDTTVPKSCPSPDVLDGVLSPRNSVDYQQRNGSCSPDQMSDKDLLIEQLQKEIEMLRMDLQRLRIEYGREIDDHKRQQVALENHITDLENSIRSLKEENEHLTKNHTSEEVAGFTEKLDEAERKAKVQEEKFLKLKEVYSKLREEHIALIRGKAESDKQVTVLKNAVEVAESMKQSLLLKVEDLSNSKHIELEELQKSSLKVELSVLSNEKDALLQKNAELESQLSDIHSKYSALESQFSNASENIQDLGNQLQEIKEQNSHLEKKNRTESERKISYLDSILKEGEHILQVALDELDSPALSTNSTTPEYLLRQLDNITTTTDQFRNAYIKYSSNPEDMEDMLLQSATYFAHLMANVLMEGKATSNASPNIELGDQLCASCKNMGLDGLSLYKKLLQKASSEDISSTFAEVVEKISGVIKVMEELVPKMSEDDSKKLGDIIERELKQMDIDIEEAAQRIQDLLNNSKAGDSGMKLEVNSKILDSCTSLMQAIKVLVHASKNLQEEIVSQAKGTASVKEFYNRNHRWTEGLISAAKVVGLGARFLVNAADKVVNKQTKFEELVVASQQIAAATAQLVIASRVKAERGSEKLVKVSAASKRVAEATGQVVATAKSCAEMVEESEEMDFSKLSLHQAKRLEVESQVRVLELENMLVKERVKLANLRKKHYQLAGASEGWEEEDMAQ